MIKMDDYIIGIDPDTTNASAALVESSTGSVYAFLRKAKPEKGSTKEVRIAYAAHAAYSVCQDIMDHIGGIECASVRVYIEHQNAAHVEKAHAKGKGIRWQDIINLGHVAGSWAGAVCAVLDVPPKNIHTIYARQWKQQTTKWVNQTRTLDTIAMPYKKMGGKKPYPVPTDEQQIGRVTAYSHETPNDGDWLDINDSLGIALWGHKRGK